jgi:hypothetical protein
MAEPRSVASLPAVTRPSRPSLRAQLHKRRAAFSADIDGTANVQRIVTIGLAAVLGAVLALVLGFIGARIVMSTAAGQLPGYFEDGREVINATQNANLDDGGPADSLLSGLSPILALVIILGPLGAILGIGTLFVIVKGRRGATT